MTDFRLPTDLHRAAIALMMALFVAACSTSSPEVDEPSVEEVADDAQVHDQLQALLASAQKAYDQRADIGRAEEAIDQWQRALDSPAATGDSRVKILLSLAEAHHFMGRYAKATGVDDVSSGERSLHAMAGLEAAEDALRLKAPEFLESLERGAPFEEELADPPADATPALLWYAKNLHLLATTGGVAKEVETTPVVEAIMEFATEHDPDAHHGAAHRYFGVRWVERPFHKSAEESRAAFEQSVQADADFLLNRLLRARHLAVFDNDRDAFERELQAILDAPDDGLAENEVVRKWAAQLLDRSDEFFD